jgi:hypothetical protein
VRRYLPAFAVLLAVAVVATDWPLGWSFWFVHPLAAASTAGLVLLLITGAVVDTLLRRREARRWVDLGRGAAHSFVDAFWVCAIAVMHLIGVGAAARVPLEVEAHLGPGRALAEALVGPANPSDDEWVVGVVDLERARMFVRERLPILLLNRDWRSHAVFTIARLKRMQADAIAEWISAFGVLDDEEGFRRVGHTIEMLDRAEAVLQQLLACDDLPDTNPTEPAHVDLIKDTVDHYEELVRRYVVEEEYWERRLTMEASTIGHAGFPMTQRGWSAPPPTSQSGEFEPRATAS